MTNPNNNPPANPPITVLPPGTNQFDEMRKLARDESLERNHGQSGPQALVTGAGGRSCYLGTIPEFCDLGCTGAKLFLLTVPWWLNGQRRACPSFSSRRPSPISLPPPPPMTTGANFRSNAAAEPSFHGFLHLSYCFNPVAISFYLKETFAFLTGLDLPKALCCAS
jgi:hypothetical protein